MLAAFRKKTESNLVQALKLSPFVLARVVAVSVCLFAISAGSIVSLATAGDVDPSSEVATSAPPASSPQLTDPLSATPPAANSDETSDETRLLLQQLGKLETWTAIEPPAGESSDARHRESLSTGNTDQDAESLPPLIIPGLIDRPDGIDDQNVGPIPTRPTDAIEGSSRESVTTTIPVVPGADGQSPPANRSPRTTGKQDNPSTSNSPNGTSQDSIYDATPQLLTQTTDATSSLPTTIGANDAPASFWQIAVAQFGATFLGVVCAIGLFLIIRASAMRLFGTQLGVTFHVASSKSASAESRIHDESADVVPFGSQNKLTSGSTAVETPPETKRADGTTDPGQDQTPTEEQPASVPLRRVA